MSKIKKLFGLLLAIMMLASIMTACQKEQATPASDQIQEATQPAESTTAEEAVVEEKPGIGPDMLLLPTMENMGDKFPGSWDNYGLIGRMMLFSRVLRLDAKLQPTKGDLAESWTRSDDGKTYTFKLHDGVKFHDGSTLTSEDIVASLDRIRKPPEGIISPRSARLKDIESITAPDEHTVVMTLSISRA